jgi:hypothetical protein
MGLSGGRPGSYRRRLRRKYRRLRRRRAAGQWRTGGPSRAGQASSHWPFADDGAGQERPGCGHPGRPQIQRTRPQRAVRERAGSMRARPGRARRRGRTAPGDVPASLIIGAGVGTAIVIAVTAGALGVSQWVAAGDAANTTVAASPARSTATAPTPGPRPSPVARQSPASRRLPTARSAAVPGRGSGWSVASPGGTWPGLGPDWARPNPRRVMLSAILGGVASDILHALLPDPYRSARHPAPRGRAP